jgi:hypothetical protein
VNAGLAIGAALGGLALQFASREAYLAVFAMDAMSFLISALVLLRLPVGAARTGHSAPTSNAEPRRHLQPC